jgi:hypothetical protein
MNSFYRDSVYKFCGSEYARILDRGLQKIVWPFLVETSIVMKETDTEIIYLAQS